MQIYFSYTYQNRRIEKNDLGGLSIILLAVYKVVPRGHLYTCFILISVAIIRSTSRRDRRYLWHTEKICLRRLMDSIRHFAYARLRITVIEHKTFDTTQKAPLHVKTKKSSPAVRRIN